MIFLDRRDNSDMLPLVSEIYFLPMQRCQVGAFVDVHFGLSLQGVFLLQVDPVCKQAHISLQ